MCAIERKGLLQKDQTLPRRPLKPVILEPGAGLLWREDWECERVPELDEGSEGV